MSPSHARVARSRPVSVERRAFAFRRLLGAVALCPVTRVDMDVASDWPGGGADRLRDLDFDPSMSREVVTPTPERSGSDLSGRPVRYTKVIDFYSQRVITRGKRPCEGVGLAGASGSQI